MSIDIFNIESPAWMNTPGRNCATIDDDLTPQQIGAHADRWHPTSITRPAARALCHGCPVVAQCRSFAMNNPDLSGVWGGVMFAESSTRRVVA